MEEAFSLWKSGTTIYKAAKLTGVPKNTLRDRTAGLIDPKCHRSGFAPLFSVEEESELVAHVKETSHLGYGYTRKQFVNLISDTAVLLKKRSLEQKPVSQKWITKFLHRHPDLKCGKPQRLSMVRAKLFTKTFS